MLVWEAFSRVDDFFYQQKRGPEKAGKSSPYRELCARARWPRGKGGIGPEKYCPPAKRKKRLREKKKESCRVKLAAWRPNRSGGGWRLFGCPGRGNLSQKRGVKRRQSRIRGRKKH